jgi:UDP-N-acetylmuramate dehydrogenase
MAGELAASLPKVRGRVQAGAKLAPTTWFRVGGPAEVLMRPADEDDLADFLRALPEAIEVFVIGAASNLIVRDGGVNGVVVRLGGSFGEVRVEADALVAGAAALDTTVAETAAAAGLSGMVLVTTTSSRAVTLDRRSMAGLEKMGCVQ